MGCNFWLLTRTGDKHKAQRRVRFFRLISNSIDVCIFISFFFFFFNVSIFISAYRRDQEGWKVRMGVLVLDVGLYIWNTTRWGHLLADWITLMVGFFSRHLTIRKRTVLLFLSPPKSFLFTRINKFNLWLINTRMKHGENYEQSKALISLFLSLTSSSFFLTSIDSIWRDSGWSTCSCFESNRVCRRRQAFQEHKRGCLLRFSVCLPPSSFEPLEFYSSHVRICEFHSFRLWLFLIPHDDDMAFAFAPKWFDFARKEGFLKCAEKMRCR